MTSEIRANTLKNRVGLGTVSFTNTGPVVSGIVTANTFRLPDATSGSLGRLQFGNGLDLSLFHDGTNSFLVNNTGYLSIQSQDGVNGIFIARNAEVNLYYGSSVRMQTSSAGITVNKDLDVDGHTNLDNVSVAGVSTFSGSVAVGQDLFIPDKIVHSGDPDTAIRFPTNDIITAETGGDERLRITSDGKLLVGKISGSAKVDIDASNSTLRLTKANATDYVGFQLDRDTSNNAGGYLGLAGTTNHYISGSAQHDLCLRSQSNLLFSAGGNVEKLRITSSGNVLIGTTSATAEFTVRGGGTVASFEGTGGSGAIAIRDADAGTYVFLKDDGGVFHIQTSGSSYSDKFSILTNGNTGINETSPDNKLHITTTNDTDYSTDTLNTVNQTNALLRLENTSGSDGSGVNNYVGIYFRVANGANSDAQLQYVRTGDNKGAFHFKARNAGSSYPNLMTIKSDGVISFDGGTTAAVTSSQKTTSSIGHQTMSGGSSWFNHGTGVDYFGVDGDFKLTNGATYGKIVARNTQSAISNATEAGHTWFLVCKTVAGTLGNSNWVVEPVAGWKMAWPTSLAGGASATFYMRDAVESYGSPTIPASGDYYLGWAYSVSQQRGTNGGSYYVDNTSGGKIYYYDGEGDMSNPHQRIPRQGDSWSGTMSGEKIHFRFETLPKADLTGTIFTSPLLVDPVIQGTPLIDGLPMAGGQLVKDVQWATNVSSVEFMNADFVNCNYLVTYSVNGSDGVGDNSGWYQTRLQFCDHDGSFFTDTNDYISHTEWNHSTSSSPSINTGFSGYQRSIWLTGNGSNYDHEGYVWIIPSNFRHNRNATISQRWGNGIEYTSLTHPRIFVRGHSHLSSGVDGQHYREEGGGTYRGTNGVFNISGFRLYGSAASNTHTPASNGSSNGYVRIWRFKSGLEAREVS